MDNENYPTLNEVQINYHKLKSSLSRFLEILLEYEDTLQDDKSYQGMGEDYVTLHNFLENFVRFYQYDVEDTFELQIIDILKNMKNKTYSKTALNKLN